MATATAAASARDGRRRLRRPRLRLPESLACAGLAMAVSWPGVPFSSTYLVMVTACLVPLGVRTLLRLEEVATIPSPTEVTAGAVRATEAYRACYEHARSGLALLDLVDVPGLGTDALVTHGNRALAELTGADPIGRRLADLLGEPDTVVRSVLRALATGAATDWDGEQTLAGDAGRTVRLHLVRLPGQESNGSRVSLTAVALDRPATSAPRADQAPPPNRHQLPLAG